MPPTSLSSPTLDPIGPSTRVSRPPAPSMTSAPPRPRISSPYVDPVSWSPRSEPRRVEEGVRLEQVAAVAAGVPAPLRAAQGDDDPERGALVGQAVALHGPEGLLALVVAEVDQVVSRATLDDVADHQPDVVLAALLGAAVGATEDLVRARTRPGSGRGRPHRRSRRCRPGRRSGRRRRGPGSRRAGWCRAGCRRASVPRIVTGRPLHVGGAPAVTAPAVPVGSTSVAARSAVAALVDTILMGYLLVDSGQTRCNRRAASATDPLIDG